MAQRVQGGLGSQILWHSTHESGEVISLTHRPPVPPGNVSGTHFHKGLSWPQGHGMVGRNMSLKNPVTPPGINPGTIRLVVQHLNHYATTGPYHHIFILYMGCPESIQPFWIYREPVTWPWRNLAASQGRPYWPSVNSNSPVGLVSWQWDALDWTFVLCDHRIHNNRASRSASTRQYSCLF